MNETVRKCVIIGSGPAGLTSAIYTARANMSPLVIAGLIPGGQLMLTTTVENFPGFPEGVDGPELMMKMREQSEKFGTEFVDEDVSSVDVSSYPYRVIVGDKEFLTYTIIIATGASAKWLDIPSEERFKGHGVSSCATCDGAFFKGKNVIVAGGGDVAMEDGIFLTKFANKVTVVHRRDRLRASKVLEERAFKNEKMNFIWNSVIDEILGDNKVRSVKLKNVLTGVVTEIPCDGVFIAIGHKPNTEIFHDKIDLDEKGYIKVHENVKTSREGIFACGDVTDPRYRQAITAAGSGCMAALMVEHYLEEKEL
ncbi:MAG: thioredoxin-disulfide reductase [Candidatus Thermoplasmatota archaeon]|jgi:thioredoxin reductase (NADPH)|nr:thioredoxin-disulfide reductase [Candidatus Thermoplasmatota archaeon]MCL5962840.1 thioredoxin-disulfide reductase [Candidatus Thermoplasmatota archaeon]